MIEEPLTRDAIGKYVVYFNGCFAPKRYLKIVGISDGGMRVSFEWDGQVYTEPIHHITAIVSNKGDE